MHGFTIHTKPWFRTVECVLKSGEMRVRRTVGRGVPRLYKNAPLMTWTNIDNLLRAIEQHQCDLYTLCSTYNGCNNKYLKLNSITSI